MGMLLTKRHIFFKGVKVEKASRETQNGQEAAWALNSEGERCRVQPL